MLIRLFLLGATVAVALAAGVTAEAATHAGTGDRLTRDVSTPEPPVTVDPATPEPPDPQPPVTVDPATPEPPDPQPPVTVKPQAPAAPATVHITAPAPAAAHAAPPAAARTWHAASASPATRRAAILPPRSPSAARSRLSTPATRAANRPRGHRDARSVTIAQRRRRAGDAVRRSPPQSRVAVHRRRPATTATPLAVAAARVTAPNLTMSRLAPSDPGSAIPLWSVIGFVLLVIGLRTFRPTDQ
jgi:hypothetical protein